MASKRIRGMPVLNFNLDDSVIERLVGRRGLRRGRD
jgi:hypothetical protein